MPGYFNICMRNLTTLGTALLFILASCSQKLPEQDFFTHTVQSTDERVIDHYVSAIDSFSLFRKYDIASATELRITNDTLLIPDSDQKRLVRINGNDPTLFESSSLQEGEGPGELGNMQGLDTNETGVLIADSQQRKVVLLPASGEGLKEQRTAQHSPHRISWISADTYAILSPISDETVFHLLSIEEGHLRSFGPAVSPPNPLKYEGHIQSAGQHLYYAGLAEPVLKKYTRQGELVYARATVDNFPTEGNYFTSEDSEFAMFRYTAWALYSTYHFTVSDDYWIVVPVPEEEFEETHRVIDLYHLADGSYSHSVGLDRNLRLVALRTDYLFGIHITEDREYYLVRYPNIFSGDDGAHEE